jgi:hypothetical protein
MKPFSLNRDNKLILHSCEITCSNNIHEELPNLHFSIPLLLFQFTKVQDESVDIIAKEVTKKQDV